MIGLVLPGSSGGKVESLHCSMEKSPNAVSALYPRLLGAAWWEMDERVRNTHLDGSHLRAKGLFRVEHGRSALARALLWILRMPAANHRADVRLEITAHGEGERWLRTFGDRTLASLQFEQRGGLLAERVRIMELRFRLEVAHGVLIYRQTGAVLRVGPYCLPVPRWLALQVSARESPGSGPRRTAVFVSVSAPLVGFLLKYEGEVEVEETPL